MNEQKQQQQSVQLMPEENPEFSNAATNAKTTDETILSKQGVSYKSVYDGLQLLYPPQNLEQRNAQSRTDGYWPYINNGQKPPQQLTYGEFDFYFFAQLIDKALGYYDGTSFGSNVDNNNTTGIATSPDTTHTNNTWEGKVFADIGSGTGRLVLAAAALHKWKLCRGLEILPGITNIAKETLERCKTTKSDLFELDNDEETNDNYDDDDEAGEVWIPMGSSSFDSSSAWLNQLQNQYEDNNDVNDDDHDHEDPTEDTTVASTVLNQTMEVEIPTNVKTFVSQSKQSESEYYLPNDHEGGESLVKLLSPIDFSCGSFDDPYEYFGDADCIFVFSSCMSPELMNNLAKAIGRQCKVGTIIITTEFTLPLSKGTIEPMIFDPDMPSGDFQFELLEQIDGYCWLVGGQSTGYIHRLTESLGKEYGDKRIKPYSEEQIAYEAIQYVEANREQSAKTFLTKVYNSMVYQGFPDHWLPKL